MGIKINFWVLSVVFQETVADSLTFLSCGFNRFGPISALELLYILMFLNFDRYFNGRFLVKRIKYAYIRVQRVEINKNRYFVFRFMSLPVLTVFQTVILNKS